MASQDSAIIIEDPNIRHLKEQLASLVDVHGTLISQNRSLERQVAHLTNSLSQEGKEILDAASTSHHDLGRQGPMGGHDDGSSNGVKAEIKEHDDLRSEVLCICSSNYLHCC